MILDREQYESVYFGIEGIPDYSIFTKQPESDEDFLMNYVTSKLWRMNNLYTIINKDGNKIQFIMNYAQHVVYANHLRHPRVIILKSRQRGISTFYLIDYFDDAIFINNLTVGMQSYGLEESAALLKRVDVAWDNFNPELKEFMGLAVVKANTKALGFNTGSIIKIQTSFRGETLQRLHVSELGKIANKNPQKAVELKAGTLQALAQGNRAAIESTAEGMHNAFYVMWYDAVNHIGNRSLKDFLPIFLSWVDDPDCVILIPQVITDEDESYFQEVEGWLNSDEVSFINMNYIKKERGQYVLTNEQKWWVVAQRRELDELFNQEYPYSPEAAFAAVRDGTYYARLWREKGHVVDDSSVKQLDGSMLQKTSLYEPLLDTHVSWDLGMNDSMELGFWQVHGHEVRMIDYYYNSGEGLEHYVNVLKERNYNYGYNVLPHDIKVRELGMNKTRLARLRELGVRKVLVLKKSDVATGIEMVRKMIPQTYVSATKCDRVIKMFGRYTKAWDSNLGVFKDKPLHDEWSNPADMVRYFAMSGLWLVAEKSTSGAVKKLRPKKAKTNVVDGMAI